MKVLLTKKQIENKLLKISNLILAQNNKDEFEFVCVLDGALPFFKDLITNLQEVIANKKLLIKINKYYVRLKSYEGTKTKGVIEIKKDLTKNQKNKINNKDIFIVEDIVDTGKTLSFLISYLKEFNPKSIKIISLLNKPSKRKKENNDIKPDYCCFYIEDKFVVGYGLDYNEKYRELAYIAEYNKK